MKILLGIDGSRYALAATRLVCEFLTQPGRQVDMLHVLPLVVREGAASPRRQDAPCSVLLVRDLIANRESLTGWRRR